MGRAKRLSSDSGGKGFTLVELLVALSVSSIVLAAVATLAYAMSSANDSTDDTSVKQAQVRYATLRLSELLRHSKLICFAGPDDFAVWRGDDNGNGQINASELVLVEKGSSGGHLQLCDFPVAGSDPVVALSSIQAYSTSWWLSAGLSIRRTTLIGQCSNMEFSFDALPPWARFVNVSFELFENGFSREYEISGYVRGWGGNLLNAAGDALVLIDDD
ncbi:MAG: prepilin-type N-terminal cleavage/methylation domain-containing protein [Sedimentisphaerales bacterium]|nr:prepilin-type N-terminal cleavage/methylation domain-containing protein [Sedimentisphaerales bacterium]